MKNIMIFPAGSEIGLEIYNALKYMKDINIIGGTSIMDHSYCVYENLVKDLPYIFKSERKVFVEKINEAIKKEKIDFIYPAHDMAQYLLLVYRDEIEAEIISSPIETVELCRDKKKTYIRFQKEDFVPIVYDTVNSIKEYPVFIKPCIGNSSIGAKIVQTKEELKYELFHNPDIVIMEYLSGKEYTIDCFTSSEGEMQIAEMRSRERIKAGISVRSASQIHNPDVERIAQIINQTIKVIGAWFFQLRQDRNGKLKLLEIAPRVAGTMGLTRNRGINFPYLTLCQFQGMKTTCFMNDYKISVDRAFFGRYTIDINYNVIYLDFDDTLIANNHVNCYLMMFLYQQINKGKKLVLLTRHRNKIGESLEKFKIDSHLFEQIIVIDDEKNKSEYITKKDAIFIDDSYRERMDVHKKTGISTFDLDMVESLIDWRGLL